MLYSQRNFEKEMYKSISFIGTCGFMTISIQCGSYKPNLFLPFLSADVPALTVPRHRQINIDDK